MALLLGSGVGELVGCSVLSLTGALVGFGAVGSVAAAGALVGSVVGALVSSVVGALASSVVGALVSSGAGRLVAATCSSSFVEDAALQTGSGKRDWS
jgi:hypothetical protein